MAGYENTNGATYLRDDPTLRTVAGTADRPLASQPTLSRLENAVDWESIRLLKSEGAECRHGATRGEIILDMDWTEDRKIGPTGSRRSRSATDTMARTCTTRC